MKNKKRKNEKKRHLRGYHGKMEQSKQAILSLSAPLQSAQASHGSECVL